MWNNLFHLIATFAILHIERLLHDEIVKYYKFFRFCVNFK